jgi:4-amino-4-deoxy-L-arabinose transferase-like glycosyltransferase
MNNSQPGRIEAWIAQNSGLLALAIIAAAFAIRVYYASSCYLNPDEAEHFAAARPSTWLGAYHASLPLWHPPLFILVLHAVLYIGRSELVLRLPSLIAGTAALWFAFAWMRGFLGEVPALFGLVFMAISSAAISASTEARQYGLLLFFICAALYATERAFAEKSLWWAIVQGFMLVGALLTHYTALIVLACVGLYSLVRAVVDSVPRRILSTFVAIQFALAGVLAWLYFTQIRPKIRVSSAASTYLGSMYYHAGHQTLLGFAWHGFAGTFSYLSGGRRLGPALLFVFIPGLAALLAGRTKRTWLSPAFLVSPFIAGFAAAVVQVFPFTGSRHETYLLPFLFAGLAAALLWLRSRHVVVVLIGFAIIAPPLWLLRAAPDNDPRRMPKRDMQAALAFMHSSIPKGSPLFVDFSSRDVLFYYLGRNDKDLDTFRAIPPNQERVGDYDLVIPGLHSMNFEAREVLAQVAASAGTLNIPAKNPLWIFAVSWMWTPPLADQLPATKQFTVEGKDFGRISLIKVSDWYGAKTTLGQ